MHKRIHKEGTQLAKKFFLFATLLLDLWCSLLLYFGAQDWQFRLEPPNLRSNSADVCLVALIRFIFVPLLTYLAIHYGSTDSQVKLLLNEKKKPRSGRDSDIEIGLLNDHKRQSSIVFFSEEQEVVAKQKAKYWKNILVALLFAVITVSEVHIGIKCVVFRFKNPNLFIIEAIIMSAFVVWTNVELYLARTLIEKLTSDSGIFFPKIHVHPLYLQRHLGGHSCDLCRARAFTEAYRCISCDFDMCYSCVKKSEKGTLEGVIRNDSGMKDEEELTTWQYIRKGLRFAKKQMFLIVMALTFLLLSSACTILLPNYQGKILDKVIKLDKEGFFNDIVIYVAITGTLGLFGTIRSLCFSLVGQRMLFDVQSSLVQSIFMQDIAFFDGMPTGDLISRLWNDSDAMISPVNTVLTTLLSSSISLVGGLFMCLYTSWRLSVLAFTTIGPITLIYRIYSKWSKGINKQIWSALASANSLATEGMRNIRTVRAFSKEKKEEIKYKEARIEALHMGIKDSYASSFTFALTSYLDQAIGVLILWYGGTVVMEEPSILSIGSLITFQLYWNMINTSYTNLSNIVNSFTRAGGAAQRVMGLLDNYPDIDPNIGEKVEKMRGEVTLENVNFHYQMRPDQKILKGVNLTIGAGQVCALVGRSGGGKSTLVHLMMRFYDPREGRILLDGKDLKTLNPVSFRSHIGIVAQETQLFNGTIEENISYGVDQYTQDELIEAATLANAHDFILEFDEGYQTKVGEHGQRLSGGQKQRIALARCFLKKPELLFLDEATSSLDAESESLVQDAIDNLIKMRRCTVVLVAHRLSTVINADCIAVVDQGVIAEQGNHEELLKRGGIYAKLVKRQIQRMQNTLEQGKEPQKLDTIDSLIDKKDE